MKPYLIKLRSEIAGSLRNAELAALEVLRPNIPTIERGKKAGEVATNMMAIIRGNRKYVDEAIAAEAAEATAPRPPV